MRYVSPQRARQRLLQSWVERTSTRARGLSAKDPEQTSTSWACPNEHHPPPRGRPLLTWQVTAMGAHEVGTLAALKAVPIRGAAPARRRVQHAWPLPSFVCPSQKSFGKAAWSRQVTQEKWYAPLRLSGSFARLHPFYPVFRAQSRMLIEALETLQKAARNELEPNDPPRGRKVRRKSKP